MGSFARMPPSPNASIRPTIARPPRASSEIRSSRVFSSGARVAWSNPSLASRSTGSSTRRSSPANPPPRVPMAATLYPSRSCSSMAWRCFNESASSMACLFRVLFSSETSRQRRRENHVATMASAGMQAMISSRSQSSCFRVASNKLSTSSKLANTAMMAAPATTLTIRSFPVLLMPCPFARCPPAQRSERVCAESFTLLLSSDLQSFAFDHVRLLPGPGPAKTHRASG